MNSTFKDDSEVRINMMIAEFCFSFQSSGLHFTRTYFLIIKMKIIIIFIIFTYVPALVSGELKDHNQSGKVSVWGLRCISCARGGTDCSRERPAPHWKHCPKDSHFCLRVAKKGWYHLDYVLWSPQYKIFQQLLRTNQPCSEGGYAGVVVSQKCYDRINDEKMYGLTTDNRKGCKVSFSRWNTPEFFTYFRDLFRRIAKWSINCWDKLNE